MSSKRIDSLMKNKLEIDIIYKKSVVEMIKVVDTYLEFLKKSESDLEKSFIIIGIIASLNSLYEKYMREILTYYLKIWNFSKKNKEKEFKLLLTTIHKKGKIITNFKMNDILQYKEEYKSTELLTLIEEKNFKNKYKSFDSTEEIYAMLVKPFFENSSKNLFNKVIEAQHLICNNLNEELINKNIKILDINLLKNINQVKSQVLYIYKNIRTNLIHGDFSNFEDIYISKNFDIELFGKYCILWITIIYISLENLLFDLK